MAALRTWSSDPESGTSVLDPYSVAHFVAGVAAGTSGLDPKVAALMVVAYEVVLDAAQSSLRTALTHPVPENRVNHLADVALAVAGVVVGRWARERLLTRHAQQVPAPMP